MQRKPIKGVVLTNRPKCARCKRPVAEKPQLQSGRYTQPVHRGCLAAAPTWREGVA